jgi:hypothetical protein
VCASRTLSAPRPKEDPSFEDPEGPGEAALHTERGGCPGHRIDANALPVLVSRPHDTLPYGQVIGEVAAIGEEAVPIEDSTVQPIEDRIDPPE